MELYEGAAGTCDCAQTQCAHVKLEDVEGAGETQVKQEVMVKQEVLEGDEVGNSRVIKNETVKISVGNLLLGNTTDKRFARNLSGKKTYFV